MLLILAALVFLYIAPARSLVSTLHNEAARRSTLDALQREHHLLLAQQRALKSPGAPQQAARGLGLVLPGERPYVVSGLPSN
jgi:hypothetical protein